jgi:hypothetical protein
VACSVTDFGQRPTTGERVADERMPPVMNRQRPQAIETRSSAGRVFLARSVRTAASIRLHYHYLDVGT